jgi:hypothetical protein
LNENNDMIRLKASQRYFRLFPFQQLQIFKYRQKTMTREATSMKTMTQLRVDLAAGTVSGSSLKWTARSALNHFFVCAEIAFLFIFQELRPRKGGKSRTWFGCFQLCHRFHSNRLLNVARVSSILTFPLSAFQPQFFKDDHRNNVNGNPGVIENQFGLEHEPTDSSLHFKDERERNSMPSGGKMQWWCRSAFYYVSMPTLEHQKAIAVLRCVTIVNNAAAPSYHEAIKAIGESVLTETREQHENVANEKVMLSICCSPLRPNQIAKPRRQRGRQSLRLQ